MDLYRYKNLTEEAQLVALVTLHWNYKCQVAKDKANAKLAWLTNKHQAINNKYHVTRILRYSRHAIIIGNQVYESHMDMESRVYQQSGEVVEFYQKAPTHLEYVRV